MKGMLLLFVMTTFCVSAEITLFGMLDAKAQQRYGKKYAALKSELKKIPDYDVFVNELDSGKPVKVGNRKNKYGVKSISVPDYKKVFESLANMDKHTRSSLPAFYAFVLSEVSTVTRSEAFNTKYGKPFSDRLVDHGMCEGYFWKGQIAQHSTATYSKSAWFFKKASKICTDYLQRRALMEASRMQYLATSRKKVSP